MRLTVLSAIILLSASHAAADQVTITNDTGSTIYKLYAWPTDLVARSFDILGQPLTNGTVRKVTVDNSYRDCLFTFQYDINNPADLKRRNYRRKPLANMEIDICSSKGVAVLKLWKN